MNWINGRPDDWGNLFDEPERSACEAGASAMLAARDKEWIKWFEKFWLECNIGRCKYRYRGCDNKIDNCKAWQERKKEIGL